MLDHLSRRLEEAHGRLRTALINGEPTDAHRQAIAQNRLGQPPPAIRKSVGGRNYVQINGQWYEDDGTAPSQ